MLNAAIAVAVLIILAGLSAPTQSAEPTLAANRPASAHNTATSAHSTVRKGHSGEVKKANAASSPFDSFAGNNRGPINIQSNSLSLDYKKNTVFFDGNVRATQAGGVLTSNTLDVKYGKDFRQVQTMAAAGSVRISQGVRWCTSDRAVLDQGAHTMTLTGSPVCHDADDQIAGTRIIVHLDTGKSEVEAAKAVIFPQQSKTRDNEASADHLD